jgi:hypothetical protein
VSSSASVCNGQGACTTPTSTSCGSANYCTGGSCVPKLGNGTSCATSTECSSANCSGGTCCAAGLTGCSGTCYDLATNTANCGACGHACPAPPVVGSGSATCSAGSCGLACNAGYLLCSGTSYCQIASWGFEDGTTDGFAKIGSQPAVTGLSVSTAAAHTGTSALAIGVTAMGMTNRGFQVGLDMCGGSGYVPAGSHVVSAWLYLQPSDGSVPPPAPTSHFGVHLYTSSSDGGDPPTTNVPVGTWFQVSSTVSTVGSQLTALSIQGVFDTDGTPATDWSGTVYVDDVTIQ